MPSRLPFVVSLFGRGLGSTVPAALVVAWAALGSAGSVAQTAPVAQEAWGRPFVTINGEPQSVARAEVLLREQLARGAGNSPQLQAAVRDLLINQTVMSQAAIKEGLDKLPLVQAQIELARQSVLAQA
jgi:peptidyl-prolyl cis-trans isomerase C